MHPDAHQAADGTLDLTRKDYGYKPAPRHADLYRGCAFPPRPNVMAPDDVVKGKPAWAEAFRLRAGDKAQAVLRAIHAGTEEEIRLRAAMMASVDEGVGMLLEALERTGQLDRTFILFLGDNGYFFGEHGLGPERRFAYEEGIRTPFVIRYPPLARAGRLGARAGARPRHRADHPRAGRRDAGAADPGPLDRCPCSPGAPQGWRRSFLVEYFTENAMSWLVGMSYKAVRTDRHKLIHWVNRDGVDELYDLEADPYELANVIGDPRYAATARAAARRAGPTGRRSGGIVGRRPLPHSTDGSTRSAPRA